MRFFICLLFLATSLHAGAVRVGVSVLPLESIVRAIGGEHIAVQSLAGEGDSCSVFEPRPSRISWLAGARLFFRTGVGYESVIVPKLESRFPDLKIVDLRESVDLLAPSGHDHHHHGHEHGGACCPASAQMTDPHIWLDPVRLMEMADLIARELGNVLPGKAEAFTEAATAFKKKAKALDQRLEALLEPYSGQAFYIYHPALGYFADRYNLRQAGIAGAGHEPTVRELHARIGEAREAGVGTIFVQPQESRSQAEVLAKAIGAEVVEINPMGADWEQTLLRIGEALAGAFGDS